MVHYTPHWLQTPNRSIVFLSICNCQYYLTAPLSCQSYTSFSINWTVYLPRASHSLMSYIHSLLTRFTFCTFLSHHQHVLYLLYTFCFIFNRAYHGWNNLLFKPVHRLLWLVAPGHQPGYQLRVRDPGLILLDGTRWWPGLSPGSGTSPPSDHRSSRPVLHRFSDPVFVTTEQTPIDGQLFYNSLESGINTWQPLRHINNGCIVFQSRPPPWLTRSQCQGKVSLIRFSHWNISTRGTRTRVDRFGIQRVGLDGDDKVTLFTTAVREKGKRKITELGGPAFNKEFVLRAICKLLPSYQLTSIIPGFCEFLRWFDDIEFPEYRATVSPRIMDAVRVLDEFQKPYYFHKFHCMWYI